ncbi:FliH/SctL family protein [Burkholderia pyrrocinia]
MHFSVLKDDAGGLDVLANSRVIKASAVAELFEAIDLRQRLRVEMDLACLDRQKIMEEARREGYAKGEQEAQRAVSGRLHDAHRFLARAHAIFEAQFAHFIVMAVTRIVASQSESDRMRAVIQHAYAALGNEIVMRIVVHPDDLASAQTVLERYRPEWKILLVEDASVTRRSCRLESPLVVVEHDWDTLIAGVETAAQQFSRDVVASMKDLS